MKKTLGGDRLGSGKRMQVDIDGYPRSTHNKSYVVRTTQAPGTIVPIMNEIGLPGETWKINFGIVGRTKPTTGPLFGNFNIQIDTMRCPIRLYQGRMHQNEVNLGLDMENVKFPLFRLNAGVINAESFIGDYSITQINPSSVLAHLGLMGVGQGNGLAAGQYRDFNGLSWLAYWDYVKNYRANKQEEVGAVIHTDIVALVENVTNIDVAESGTNVPALPTLALVPIYWGQTIIITKTLPTFQPLDQVIIVMTNMAGGEEWNVSAAEIGSVISEDNTEIRITYTYTNVGATRFLRAWRYADASDIPLRKIGITRFPLNEIDQMRGKILAYPYATSLTTPFMINDANLRPFSLLFDEEPHARSIMCSQEGLALATYKADLFNNWLNGGLINVMNQRSNVSTVGNVFTMEALLMARRVYELYNKIIASGSSMDDWEEAVWGMQKNNRTEIPVYEGGLSQDMGFEEVVSNTNDAASGQPLGTLAGKGVMHRDRKGGNVVIRVDEPSILLACAVIVPRIDYSNGNDWSFGLETLDDLHKPEFDQIGFQDLDAEQLAWWATAQEDDGTWVKQSAGKQPAWMNYRTNVNRLRGNFAISTGADAEQFQVLARNYKASPVGQWMEIADVTTYIDPVKFNQIFAVTALDAQNFWMQYGVDIEKTMIMSPREMPVL